MRAWLCLLVSSLAVADPQKFGQAPRHSLGAADSPRSARLAEKLMQRFECYRCHPGPALESPFRHCVDCHQAILQGKFDAPEADLAHWREHIVSLTAVPSLAGTRRLRRAWVRRFLLEPRDLRPGLRATMPRLPLSQAQADELARALVPVDPPESAPEGDVERGRRLYDELRCASCHAFSGVVPGPSADAKADGVMLAPDLAFVHERFQGGALADYLQHPDGFMPSYGLDEARASALAAFLWRAPPGPRPPPRRTVLPLLQRRVGYAEVYERVFRRTCRHCHSSPELNYGDGGPGNSGGFGFAGRGLDLSGRMAMMRGWRDEKGVRHSLFAPGSDGTPLIVAALRARWDEEDGGLPPLRGMPLGLPALSPEELQLVESWVAQGRPE
jgi:mono/diheme cytochrome c family protein